MLQRKLIARTFLLATLVTVAAAAAPRDVTWRASDHDKVGKDIATYYDAKDNRKDIGGAWEKLSKTTDRVAKKFKDDDILSFVEDWEAALKSAAMSEYREKPKKGKVQEIDLNTGGASGETWASFPKSYSTKKDPYPLVLVIPDEGKTPHEHIDAMWTDTGGRENAIIVAVDMPKDADSWLLPADPAPAGIGAIMSTYGYMRYTYAIDMDRVFLAGSGRGISAALATAAYSPHCFAGVIGRGAVPEFKATNFRTVPTLFVAGGKYATEFEAAAKEGGYGNCNLLTTDSEADVWAWMGEKVRDAYPDTLTFQPFTPQGKICSWLQINGFDVAEEPLIEAKVDRAANTIEVTAEKISTVTIYFNDAMVDLDEPVKVVVNGVPHEQRLPRARRNMLDRCYSWGDWGRIFTAHDSFDIGSSGD